MNKKTIWITGGSTGIGKALAIKFASKGWNVAISARRESLLKEISDENENIHGFPLDVTDKSKCKEVFQQIKDKFQEIDVCFFSTGTWNPKKEKDIDVEQIDQIMDGKVPDAPDSWSDDDNDSSGKPANTSSKDSPSASPAS